MSLLKFWFNMIKGAEKMNPGLVKLFGLLLCFTLLLSLGGCKNQKDLDNDLIRAAELGNEKDVSRLLRKNADANARDMDGYPALYFAAYKGHKNIVALLLDKGADVTATGKTGYTPLHGAAMGGRKEVAELLIEKGADVNARSVRGITPLHEARGNEGVRELLIANGANAK